MQRVGADDISDYALRMEAYEPEEDEEVNEEDIAELAAEREEMGIDPLPVRDGTVRKYRHIIYKAHFDGAGECKGAKYHGRKSPAYPEGCLLFPRKLTYPKCMTKAKNDPGKYRLWWQQESVELGNILVEPIWIKGGRDEDGFERPGCWDSYRSARTMPEGLTSSFKSFITVDPSPTNFWAIAWWIYHDPSKELYLIDLLRQKMTSRAFFDMNPNTTECTGEIVDIYNASRIIGAPIEYVVAEDNAAQKFMYDSSAIMQWLRQRGVALWPHTTTKHNKNSQEYGVQALQSWFRDGRIRLPGKPDDAIKTRTRSLKLVDEATHYKLDGTTTTTTDCVMATWFAAYNVDKLFRPKKELPNLKRPNWAGSRLTYRGILSA